jgi:hypothetical protein
MKKRNNIIYMFIFAACFSLLIIGCTKEVRITKHVPYIAQWLSKPACDPPCWENITPGRTTMQQGMEKLKELSDVEKIEAPRILAENQVQISWTMKNCKDYSYGYFNASEDRGGIIENIYISVTCVDDNTIIEEVTQSFGLPDFTWTERKGIDCSQKVLYLEKGMLLDTYIIAKYPFGTNDFELQVLGILFFEPKDNLKETLGHLGYPEDKEISIWQETNTDLCGMNN